jgi:glutaredoxin 2
VSAGKDGQLTEYGVFSGLMYPVLVSLGPKLPEFATPQSIAYFVKHKEAQMNQTMDEARAEKADMIVELTDFVYTSCCTWIIRYDMYMNDK